MDGFADLVAPTGPTKVFQDASLHHLIVTRGPPVFERPRRLFRERLDIAKAEFDALLDQGIIRPSSSPWASPLRKVVKTNGGWGATVDYRRLNAVTVPDRYPLPAIEDQLQGCHGRKVFSVVDLRKAFHQIPVAPEDVPKTAVTTPFGLFEFVGTPLSLRNSAQTLQRFMNWLLRKLSFVRCYLDDILILSETHEEHLEHLLALLSVLRQAGLTINMDKSVFGQDSVKYLRYIC